MFRILRRFAKLELFLGILLIVSLLNIGGAYVEAQLEEVPAFASTPFRVAGSHVVGSLIDFFSQDKAVPIECSKHCELLSDQHLGAWQPIVTKKKEKHKFFSY